MILKLAALLVGLSILIVDGSALYDIVGRREPDLSQEYVFLFATIPVLVLALWVIRRRKGDGADRT
jgi:hypothetical protein